MKLSKRNLANKEAENVRLAAGKPRVSKFEKKSRTREELHELELSLTRRKA